jgi:hypothetical protein
MLRISAVAIFVRLAGDVSRGVTFYFTFQDFSLLSRSLNGIMIRADECHGPA